MRKLAIIVRELRGSRKEEAAVLARELETNGQMVKLFTSGNIGKNTPDTLFKKVDDPQLLDLYMRVGLVQTLGRQNALVWALHHLGNPQAQKTIIDMAEWYLPMVPPEIIPADGRVTQEILATVQKLNLEAVNFMFKMLQNSTQKPNVRDSDRSPILIDIRDNMEEGLAPKFQRFAIEILAGIGNPRLYQIASEKVELFIECVNRETGVVLDSGGMADIRLDPSISALECGDVLRFLAEIEDLFPKIDKLRYLHMVSTIAKEEFDIAVAELDMVLGRSPITSTLCNLVGIEAIDIMEVAGTPEELLTKMTLFRGPNTTAKS